MAEFFSLTTPKTEDKLVSSLVRVYDNTAVINDGYNLLSLITASAAPRQRIRFFIDVAYYRVYGYDYNPTTNPLEYADKYEPVGQWIEAESGSIIGVRISHGVLGYKYECAGGNGNYSCGITATNNLLPAVKSMGLYISSISFSDSFFDESKAWLVDENDENIIDKLTPTTYQPPAVPLTNYSYEEQNTGLKWVDGRYIYQKTLNFGVLPNTTAKSVAHGIVGLDYFLSYDAIAEAGAELIFFPLPFSDPSAAAQNIRLTADATNITVTTGINRSSSVAFITLKYVKKAS